MTSKPEAKRLDATTAVLAVVTTLVTAFVLLGPGSPVAKAVVKWSTERSQKAAVSREWTALESLGRRLDEGPRGGSVIVEFSDYECPYCRTADAAVSRWLAERSGVGVVYLHFPLAIHQHAAAAAAAAECAGNQGRFTQMHHRLMSTTTWQVDTNWVREAVSAGVPDIAAFSRCQTDSTTVARVNAQVLLGQELGVRGTPTFIGPQSRHVGSAIAEDLDRLVGTQQ